MSGDDYDDERKKERGRVADEGGRRRQEGYQTYMA